MEILGKCYYCGKDVIHEKKNDYGAYTKRWNKKKQCYDISDYWHMHCYFENINRLVRSNV